MKLLALVSVLSLVGAGQAIKCYSCSSSGVLLDQLLSEVPESARGLLQLDNLQSCDGFDPANPMDKFVTECSAINTGCLKAGNALRSCFPLSQDECTGGMCVCDSDLCNGSGQVWPSVAALLAGLAAALLGGR